MKNNKIVYLALLAAGIMACEPEFDNEVTNGSYSAGEADFSSYVALGNSLTAGTMDGTLSCVGQKYSFPSMLAKQFALVGGGEFTQPSFEEDVNNLGGISGLPGFPTRLIIDASAGGPEPIAGTSTITLTQQKTAYNNMGVPGAKSFHLIAPGYGDPAGLATTPISANPYFVRHATAADATVLGDAMMKAPTFFTNWIGNNDVLSYTTSGGVGVDQMGNMNPATYGSNDITDPDVFAGAYSAIINTLTSNGAKGVVATIPNVTSVPYFTTVPYNPLNAVTLGEGNEAVGLATIQELNTSLYGPLSAALDAIGQPGRIGLFSAEGGNPVMIKDESLTNVSVSLTAALVGGGVDPVTAAGLGMVFGQARQATDADFVLLPTRSVIGSAPAGAPAMLNKYGITYPLEDQHVLTAAEASLANAATVKFNNTIKAIAQSKGLAVADMNAILAQLTNGLKTDDGQVYYGNYFSTATLSTALFSLDGIHPNARGYAIVTNEIIKVINSYYKAKLPLVSAGDFPGATVLPSN
ncbi:G-D-S-L family lipolytic protein [Flavobacterium sp. MK4S-17]|uniref:G-D-S-L family lipolytic protein n=1 Tax=Flavobacterium sp. MK4S-17 TaxID=2543737 RepID=UPI00135690B4|nr:G-D-S-L family lipolytic protein [Flavobacterium sp. MK4S-17]